MSVTRNDLLRGTLDMLILTILSEMDLHGWGICERIEDASGKVFAVNHGSLYPALQRLVGRGLVTADWRMTANNRKARYYCLTAAGREQLELEVAGWERSSNAVERVLARAGLVQ